VFLGSSAVEHSPPGMDDYAAAKAAASNYLGALDRRYAAYGVRGKVVAPGCVRGEFSRHLRPPDADYLLPEEVADVVGDLADEDDRNTGAYVSVAPGNVRCGSFTFMTSSAPPADPAVEASAGETRGRQPAEHSADAPAASGHEALEALVRKSLHLSDTADLSEAGLDSTPGWDSLTHLQLLLSVESALGISFSSHELSRTTRLADLRRLVEAKRQPA
jgi:acyl carrier protein